MDCSALPAARPAWLDSPVTVGSGARDALRPPRRKREGHGHGPLHGRPHADGPAARRVPLRRPPARADRTHRHREGAGPPRRDRRRHARGRARRALRRHGQGPAALREGHRPLRGRHRRRRRGHDGGDRRAAAALDRGRATSRSPSSPTSRRRLAEGAHARAPRLGVVRGRRGAGTARQRPRLLHDREGRRRRRAGGRRRRRQGAATSPTPMQGVPIEPRAVVAQWQGDRVTIWSSTQVPYVARAGVAHTLADPRVQRARDRAAARRRLRRQVRLPLRGARRSARARGAAAREARLLAPRGVRRGRPSPRGHGDRARDRRAQRRHARSRGARGSCSTSGAYCGEGGFFAQMAAMHALRPVRARDTSTSSRRSSTRTTSRPPRSARRPRRRSAGRSSSTWTSSRRRSSSIRSSCAAAR